mmetsp:Transcript_17059/g.28234  ORF Transcript_17059/g.28234 Transcript_17059/m.28234 type:complete len:231 (+) Transcript_17059:79-771(+)|eukprot:jgi/Bigna1/51886/estExt_Genewise1Plus.C_40032
MSEKTEWEDALVKHGIISKTVKGPTQDELDLKAQEEDQARDKLDDLTLDDLDEQEDDLDDEILNKYRAKRMAELKQAMSKNKFGEVYELTEQEYKSAVTEASNKDDGVYVVLHLYAFGKLECRLLNEHMSSVAKKYKYVKFCKIKGSECIHGFPDSKCPTILIYYKGEIFKTIEGLSIFGGKRMNAATLVWRMVEWKMIDAKLEKDPFENLNSINVTRGGRRKEDDYDDL